MVQFSVLCKSMFYNFKVITLRGTGRGASGGMHLGALALDAHQHTLFRHLKSEFFSRNLSQNMPKNRYFLEKGCKIAAEPGGSALDGLRRLGTPPPDSRVVTPIY